VLAQSDAAIVAVHSSVDSMRGLAEVRVTLRVGDFEQLSQLLGRLGAVPGVQEARRLG
jgi:GTP pyrophosphokinase